MPTFRNVATAISSPRLLTYKAVRMVYAFIGVPLDALTDAANQATKARFPMTAPEDALFLIGRDRGIIRGPHEPSASYRARLLLWIEAWKGAGVGRAMLDQLAGYLTPAATRIRVWSQVGIIYTREASGAFTIEHPAAIWNWDERPDLWARFWVIIDSVGAVPWAREPPIGTAGHVIGERAAAGGTIGSTATVSEVESIRAIVSQWKPAAAKCPHIIVSFDAAAFDPADVAALPDGHWANYWDSATLAAHRDTRAIYWEGV